MKKGNWKVYAAFITASEAVGILSALLTRDGMNVYKSLMVQPPLSPPSTVFPIVWTILFALMGISAAKIYMSPPSVERNRGLVLFAIQLLLNFTWTVIFFGAQEFGWALLCLAVLWLAIAFMIGEFRGVSKAAARLQIPYIIWVSFAAYLNLGVWILNS